MAHFAAMATNPCLDCRKRKFNRVEIRAVWWQEDKMNAPGQLPVDMSILVIVNKYHQFIPRFTELTHSIRLVYSAVVHDQNGVWEWEWIHHLHKVFHKVTEGFGIEGSLDDSDVKNSIE